MARRSKTSPAEDLLDLVSLLPWWAGVALAIAGYVALHFVASQPLTTNAQPGQVGAMATQAIWRGLASAFQYIVPVICLAGAAVSVWRRRERQNLVTDVAQSRAADALDGMSWDQFEKLVGEGFRLQGYRVAETGGGGADGGVDLVLTKESEKFLVQCKHWRALKVGVDVVRELYGVMAARGATGGFVVTSGRFTDEAAAFAKGRNVSLIDGPALHALIRRARGAASAVATPEKSDARRVQPESGRTQARSQDGLSCPICAKPMARRTAKRGSNSGSEFWGCTGYPSCRGTRPIG